MSMVSDLLDFILNLLRNPDAAAAFNADPLVWVLTGGDDHAVAATFPPDVTLPEGFIAIGVVRDVADVELLDAPGVTVGGRVPRGSGGHDHFTS